MTHVVTDSCIECKYTDCVTVCPVDCFHEGPNFLVINPEDCIDCALCVSECPVKAIKSEFDMLEDENIFSELNRQLSHVWPVISIQKPALPNSTSMALLTQKLDLGLLIK